MEEKAHMCEYNYADILSPLLHIYTLVQCKTEVASSDFKDVKQ